MNSSAFCSTVRDKRKESFITLILVCRDERHPRGGWREVAAVEVEGAAGHDEAKVGVLLLRQDRRHVCQIGRLYPVPMLKYLFLFHISLTRWQQ